MVIDMERWFGPIKADDLVKTGKDERDKSWLDVEDCILGVVDGWNHIGSRRLQVESNSHKVF